MIMAEEIDVAIIGAGMAGLTAAITLHSAGIGVMVFDAQGFVGGRVATDDFEGFKLDRGYQVILNAYPECKEQLNYALLDLKPFDAGALVRVKDQFIPFSLFSSHPVTFIKSIFNGLISVGDVFKLSKIARHLKKTPLDKLLAETTGSTSSVVQKYDLSPSVANHFLKPLLAGITLDKSLSSSGKLAAMAMKMMLEGPVSIPARGIGTIPSQLASLLPREVIRLNSSVESIGPNRITLHTGTQVKAKIVLIATDPWSAARLLGTQVPPPGKEVACIYYVSKKPPVEEPVIVLNGNGTGPINHLAVLSNVSPRYAPKGYSLISITVLEEELKKAGNQLESAVKDQLIDWYGQDVNDWRHLHAYRVRNAHPAAYPLKVWQGGTGLKVREGVYACGDYLELPSLNHAMLSGRKAAEQIIKEVKFS